MGRFSKLAASAATGSAVDSPTAGSAASADTVTKTTKLKPSIVELSPDTYVVECMGLYMNDFEDKSIIESQFHLTALNDEHRDPLGVRVASPSTCSADFM